MGFTKLVCPNCGAAIELSEDREYGFCTYCGTKVLQDKVVVEHRGKVSVSGVADVQALLDRATLFLEDNQFDKALDYCERVLDIDPRNSNAYTVKLLAQTHCKQVKDLSKSEKPLDKYSSFSKAVRFASSDKKAALTAYRDQSIRNYNEVLKSKNEQLDKITEQLKSISLKSEKADFWIKNNRLLTGLSIAIFLISASVVSSGSTISMTQIVLFVSSIILFALTKHKKNNAVELDALYAQYQEKASQALQEYEKWEKWIAKEEI